MNKMLEALVKFKDADLRDILVNPIDLADLLVQQGTLHERQTGSRAGSFLGLNVHTSDLVPRGQLFRIPLHGSDLVPIPSGDPMDDVRTLKKVGENDYQALDGFGSLIASLTREGAELLAEQKKLRMP